MGITACDLSTGIEGRVIYIVKELSENVRYAIQPMSVDKVNLPDAIEVDYHFVKYVDDGVSAQITAPAEEPLPLGTLIRDKYTGEQGTLVAQILYLNGCWCYTVALAVEKNSSSEVRRACIFKGAHAELVQPPPAPEPPKKVATKPPGGPTTKAIRY